jgi:hypothetical protein
MRRRQFLEAAAVVATLPVTDAAGDVPSDDGPARRGCDICGEDKPAEMVSRTTLPEIAPLRVDVCWVCEFAHQYTSPEGVCAECGERVDDEVGVGYSIEIEYPLGEADLPAHKSAHLCGDCADWKAGDITHRGVSNDDVAGPRLGRLIDEEYARLCELEAADE